MDRNNFYRGFFFVFRMISYFSSTRPDMWPDLGSKCSYYWPKPIWKWLQKNPIPFCGKNSGRNIEHFSKNIKSKNHILNTFPMGFTCWYLDLGLVFSQRSGRGEATGEIHLPLAAVDTAKSPPAASSVKSHAPLHRGGQWKKGRKTVLTRTFETWKYPNKLFWRRDDCFPIFFSIFRWRNLKIL